MNASESAAISLQLPVLVPGFAVWRRQLLAIMRIEFSKALFSRRAISCYALALIPVLILLVAGFERDNEGMPAFENIENARQIYGYIFSTLVVGAVLFLGNAAIFTTLFRGEILDHSIHYYILTPVRREILVVAKYLAGLSAACVLFGMSTALCYVLLYIPFGTGQLITDITSGIALQQIGMYLGIVLLASMGYGSLFLAAGLLFRNTLIPVVVIAGWEIIHFLLPPALKIFSIIYYLKGLLPIPLDEGPLAVIVAPPPVWVSIAGMFGLSVVAVTISIAILRRLEVKYSDE